MLCRIIILLIIFHVGHGASTAAPNILLIVADDLGYNELGFMNNTRGILSPHLDSLASNGVTLKNHYSQPICSPTRSAMMTGRYPLALGTQSNVIYWDTPWSPSLDNKFLPQYFQDLNYTTAMFGKWHLGDNYPFRPEDRGFTEVVRHGGGGVGQTPDLWDNAYFDDMYFHNSVPKRYKGYCSDVYFTEAKRFIKESKSAGKPFFAYISTNAPHSPFHCPDKYWKPYLDKVKGKANTAIFFGMIANIDENVGSMRAFLEEQGVADNTIFIFTTDNGSASGSQVHNFGMSGKKGSSLDGGHRVPFFMHWKNGGLTKGTDINQLSAHIDVLPTLIDLCGLKPLEDSYKPDGKSLVPLIKNPQAKWNDRTIITDSQRVKDPIKWRNCSTMTQKWRMINGKELFDIQKDPALRLPLDIPRKPVKFQS